MRVLYKPQQCTDFLAEEHFRLERDKRIVKSYQQRQAELSAYKVHSMAGPWAVVLLIIAAAILLHLVKANHWWGIR